MSRISHFQLYSHPENHATNNTLLMLRHLYYKSPYKIQGVLSSLLETELSIGLSFDQQIKGTHGVPDALIAQAPLRIFIETKRGGAIDKNQIQRHFQTITSENGTAGSGDFLIALTKDPIAHAERKELAIQGAEKGISFTAVTFSQLVEGLREQSAEYEPELTLLIDDYENYLGEENLLETRNEWLLVFPCGTSLSENAKFGLYYEPATRRCKNNHRFIGVYKEKMVRYVGVVETIVIVSYIDNKYDFTMEAGVLTDLQKNRITDAIDASAYYNLKDYDTRFYMVDQFVEANARKVSPGGIMGHRYLPLGQMIQNYDPRKDLTSVELAEALKGKTWI